MVSWSQIVKARFNIYLYISNISYITHNVYHSHTTASLCVHVKSQRLACVKIGVDEDYVEGTLCKELCNKSRP